MAVPQLIVLTQRTLDFDSPYGFVYIVVLLVTAYNPFGGGDGFPKHVEASIVLKGTSQALIIN
jgi:hypothetical protein